MSKQYEIRNFDDLCNLVNNDNIKTLSEDLKNWLITYHLTIEMFRKNYPEQTKGKLNSEIAKGAFTWIDDKKNDVLGMTFETEEGKLEVDF